MRAEQAVANAWADRISQMIVQSVIANFEELPKDCMQSGDDSCLQNVWEEFCVQAQLEESAFWDMYLDMANDFLEASVVELDQDEQLALWLRTEPGWDWNFDHQEDKNADAIAPIAVDEIVTHLSEQLLRAAADYESDTIERYLSQSEYEYEEDDEDEVDCEDVRQEDTVDSVSKKLLTDDGDRRSITPYIRVLEHLSYILECAALNYLGEAKSELLNLAGHLESDDHFAIENSANIAEELRAAECFYRHENTPSKASSILIRVSRGLWKPVMNYISDE